jgi:hypothetical protein
MQSGLPYYLASTRVQSVCVYQANTLLTHAKWYAVLFGQHACSISVRLPGQPTTHAKWPAVLFGPARVFKQCATARPTHYSCIVVCRTIWLARMFNQCASTRPAHYSCKAACRIIWPARVFNQCASTRPACSSLMHSGLPYYLAGTRVQTVCVYQASPLLMQSGLLFYLGRHACLNSVRLPGQPTTHAKWPAVLFGPAHVFKQCATARPAHYSCKVACCFIWAGTRV